MRSSQLLCNAAGLVSPAKVKEVSHMKRILLVLAVALVMAAMAVAMAMPAFADSLASSGNHAGFGPRDGNNFGNCRGEDPVPLFVGQGKETARENPSFNGGPGHLPGSAVCPKL
jgi:hypothetical protein